MANYDQRGQRNYGNQNFAGRDIHIHPDDDGPRLGKALFVGVLNTFLMTLGADWGKVVITGDVAGIFGHHPNMDFWPVINSIVQYSSSWPFYIGLAVGIISFLSYLILGKNALQNNR